MYINIYVLRRKKKWYSYLIYIYLYKLYYFMRLTTGGARVCVCVCAFFSCGQQKIRQPVTIETFIIQFPGRYVRILHGKKRSSYVCIGT